MNEYAQWLSTIRRWYTWTVMETRSDFHKVVSAGLPSMLSWKEFQKQSSDLASIHLPPLALAQTQPPLSPAALRQEHDPPTLATQTTHLLPLDMLSVTGVRPQHPHLLLQHAALPQQHGFQIQDLELLLGESILETKKKLLMIMMMRVHYTRCTPSNIVTRQPAELDLCSQRLYQWCWSGGAMMGDCKVHKLLRAVLGSSLR